MTSSASDRSSPTPARHELASFFVAAGVVAAVLLVLLGVQALQFGRPGLEKMLTELAMPLGLLWLTLALAVAYAAIHRWRTRRVAGGEASSNGSSRAWLGIALVLWVALSLLGNRSVATWAWAQTQYPLDDAPQVEQLDAVILLGGGVHADPFDAPQLASDGDRIRPPLQLWHAGRVKKIIVTGTSALPGERGPADLTEELLISLGVPATAILRVSGRNTSEEMVELREVVAALPARPDGRPPRVGLVTSAYHLPRALRLARGQGLDLVPLPAGYNGSGRSTGWARELVPTSGALDDVTACWKEWLAAAVGR
ncbi:YdcF family protein [Candidatus Laterigemmans baculatus]|uniref:YdcF family protein n=1 Tax=Candidatus Laterigemmans baculatus TaxID=2770505 RepID=UPI0013DB60AD|nr:YdcF family protein [Candidatus Laterigemmans baculatus]